MANILIGLREEDQQQIFRQIPSVRDALFLGLYVHFEFRMEEIFAYLGVGKVDFSHWRRGRRNLPKHAVTRLAAILPCDPALVNAPCKDSFLQREPTRRNKHGKA